jgi:replication-associated recombination protein RarA
LEKLRKNDEKSKKVLKKTFSKKLKKKFYTKLNKNFFEKKINERRNF